MSVCFLALDKNIPESSSKEDHKRGQCVFNDPIKRVLLYQVSNIQDKGESARKLWKVVLEIMTCGMNKWERT